MILKTDGDSYEKLRSLNQNLTFDYTEKIFKENNLSFGLSQKKTLGLIGEDDLYTNLALLLSEQCNHTLKVVAFEGIEKNIFKDRKEFKGSLLKQATEAFEFINLLNKTEATFEGLTRKDERDYPLEAIREALLNAVVHREYSFSGSTLINIYEDRIEIISLGGIVLGYNEDFQKNSNIGSINNQNFVNIPYGKLRDKLIYLCKLYGIEFKLQEESYTSKASFFDGDEIPIYDKENQEEYIFSGKRIKRGLYQTRKGKLINADCKGALNILRKSKVVDLGVLYNRGELNTPKRIRVV